MPGAAPAQEGSNSVQPRSEDLVGETVADRPSAYYRFETHALESIDGKRHYRIQIGIPRTHAPAGGYPALYMLDGNAALDTLGDPDLEWLSRRNPPVLVAIGYDVPTRNDVVARAYDYTPPVVENGRPVAQPVVRGRPGGGADRFLAFIETRIKPLVRARARVSGEESLWGHSYGGLFTLHTLFTRPESFSRYVVGDPSVWWYDGALMREWEAFDKPRATGKRVAILVGTKPHEGGRPAPAALPIQTVDGRTLDSRSAAREMAAGLLENAAQATYETFPEQGHGGMLRVSLERALQIAAEPKAQGLIITHHPNHSSQ
ncbi:alpha/beta hydrolase [Castellaniella hirudinis]|uniref:alpha/beta hydrolase n=1 Tax=Castellaniella hirudinis TaxID=1144617 RepID=UPI0039C05B4F